MKMKGTSKNARTCELVVKHSQRYPDLQIQDVFKFLYQSSFGCEHSVFSCENAVESIKEEFNRGVKPIQPYVEPIDGDYSRVGLSYLHLGLSAETLGRLFFLSAKKEADGKDSLVEKLEILKELIKARKLPFSGEAFEKEAAQWDADGFPAIHHSDIFRQKYSPSYRVIANRYIPFLPLFAEIDRRLANGSVRLAIEGSSASGKTTLGRILGEVYGCTVFHMDDFFLRPEQRTPERYAEVGGNIDRERFLEEVLVPMSKGEIVHYSRFDCAEMKLMPPTQIKPEKLTVVEGVYSMHPQFARFYNLSVFLDISTELQRERILKRNPPQKAERFFDEWIPLEQTYFCAAKTKERCVLCITVRSEN